MTKFSSPAPLQFTLISFCFCNKLQPSTLSPFLTFFRQFQSSRPQTLHSLLWGQFHMSSIFFFHLIVFPLSAHPLLLHLIAFPSYFPCSFIFFIDKHSTLDSGISYISHFPLSLTCAPPISSFITSRLLMSFLRSFPCSSIPLTSIIHSLLTLWPFRFPFSVQLHSCPVLLSSFPLSPRTTSSFVGHSPLFFSFFFTTILFSSPFSFLLSMRVHFTVSHSGHSILSSFLPPCIFSVTNHDFFPSFVARPSRLNFHVPSPPIYSRRFPIVHRFHASSFHCLVSPLFTHSFVFSLLSSFPSSALLQGSVFFP